MAAPQPPILPAGLPPARRNSTILAVVLGIVIVLGVISAIGVLVAVHLLRDTHISENQSGGKDSVEIHSPLGDLKVDDSGDKTKVDIHSPFGNLKVNTTPDPATLGIEVYPGAALVTSRQDSPFHQGDWDNSGVGVHLGNGNDATGAQVEMSSGSAELEISVAEFRTPASPDQVLGYYSDLLGKLGPVERKHEHDGAQSLKVELSSKNVREAVVKPSNDGTHFVLVRVVAGNGAK